MSLPPRVRLLDPRPADVAPARPIAESVNIPVSDLARRIGELPPSSETVSVAAIEPWCSEALAFLARGGREAQPTSFVYGAAGPGRLWEPCPFLMACVRGVTPGTALDLGCGMGRDTVALAATGWRVTAVDVLPEAIERGRELAERYAPGRVIEWAVEDLEGAEDPPCLARGPFDLVVSIRYLHRPLLAAAEALLRPGGMLVVETFTVENRRVHGRPRRDAHALQLGELPGLAPTLAVARHDEGWHDGYHTARLLAHRRA